MSYLRIRIRTCPITFANAYQRKHYVPTREKKKTRKKTREESEDKRQESYTIRKKMRIILRKHFVISGESITSRKPSRKAWMELRGKTMGSEMKGMYQLWI